MDEISVCVVNGRRKYNEFLVDVFLGNARHLVKLVSVCELRRLRNMGNELYCACLYSKSGHDAKIYVTFSSALIIAWAITINNIYLERITNLYRVYRLLVYRLYFITWCIYQKMLHVKIIWLHKI